MRVVVLDAPADYADLVAPLPDGVELTGELAPGSEAVHAFVRDRAALAAALPALSGALASDGMLWLSWPKRSSPLAGDLDENGIREIALPTGLVDVKVCAVDADWSGLKLVWRKE